MKRFDYLTGFIVILVFFFQIDINSQVIIESNNKYLNETIREKLKVDIEKLLEEIKKNPNYNNELQKSDDLPLIISEEQRESQVSNDAAPESELSASINPNDTNNIIVAVMKQTTSSLTIPIYYTKDFGKTWKKSLFSPLPPRSDIYVVGGGDPVCVFDNKGTAHLTWISLSFKLSPQNKIDTILTAMHYGYSTDGGESWISDYYNSVSEFSAYSPNALNLTKLKYFDDKQWLTVDLNKNSSYENNVYICLSRFEQAVSNGAEITGCVKKANSNSFDKEFRSISQKVGEAHQFSSNSIAKNGRILVTFYGRSVTSTNSILSSFSDDGGNSYSSPQIVSNFSFVDSRLIKSSIKDSIIGVDNSRVYPSIYCASDNNENSKYYGYSYVVWSTYGLDSPSESGFNIYLAVSSDGGENWGAPLELSQEPLEGEQDQFYPTITINENGIVIISWYLQGIGGIKNNTNYVTSFSFDGGKTFSEPIASNTIPSNFSTIGTKNGRFGIGEYNQVISTKYYAIPVWSDGRDGNGNLNVYAAFIPLVEGQNTSVEKIVNFGENSINLEIFPNPSIDILNVHINNSKSEESIVTIFDVQGNIILESNVYNKEFTVNTSNIKSGTYFLEILNDGIRAVQKFQKIQGK
jgi:hypothetical protein